MALNVAAAIKLWLIDTNIVTAAKVHSDKTGVANLTCTF